MLLFFTAAISLMISLLVVFAGQLLSQKETSELEKLTPFECGFLTKDNLWSPFSMHFFLSALIFLVFDVELVLLFPFLMSSYLFSNIMSMLVALTFLFILTYGFVLEWSQSYLEWTK